MANATFSIFERTNGKGKTKYFVNLNLEGHKTSRFAGYTPKEAHNRGIQMVADYLKDPVAFFTKSKLRGAGIQGMVTEFLERAVSDKTNEHNRQNLEPVIDTYNLVRPEQIDKYLILRIKKDMAKAGLKDGSIRVRLVVLRAFVRFCLDKNYLKKDPWPNRTDQAAGGEPILPHYSSAGHFYSDADLDKLLTLPSAPTEGAYMLNRAIRLALNQGWRESTIWNFCWERIDFDRCVYKVGKLKGGMEKDVPLIPKTMDLIAEFGERKASGRLFTSWSDPKAISHAFRRLRIARGVPKGRFHDLKHTCVSKLQEKGFTLKEISEFTNTSVAALQYYQHVNRKTLTEKLHSFDPTVAVAKLKVV